jgi:hypothetical protein
MIMDQVFSLLFNNVLGLVIQLILGALLGTDTTSTQ